MRAADGARQANDFERWLAEAFAEAGAFTALVVLLDIDPPRATPLCSTYFSVVGAEACWGDMAAMFAGAGVDWRGAAFFSARGPRGGLLDNPAARRRLRELEQRVAAAPAALNEACVFDAWGRRIAISGAAP